ncbi:amidohydrolase family protein [Jiangella asiatica]|uniref:amidohydrolase family protein n=1 Tax=Jiangella asiatica TaxID=2530372 RepID=UPI0013A5F24B|nr:amidohydrolase family protein [Jiangella asiatica]
MIVDAHCHAWRRWPYETAPLDCTAEALLRALDEHGVDHALVVAARIGRPGAHNDDNNAYVGAAVARWPDRLSLAVEVDGHWSAEYGSAGAADRLDRVAADHPVAAVALYPAPGADGWLDHGPGADLVHRAGELGLPVSAAVTPQRRGELRNVARRHPGVTFLLHHLGLPSRGRDGGAHALADAYADLDNVYLKLSGLHYADATERFPYPGVWAGVVEPLLARLGPGRLVWGSDFPAYRQRATYTQARDVLEPSGATACPGRELIAGNTLARLLGLG